MNQKSEYKENQMAIESIPPRKRRVILILNRHDLTRLEYEPEGNELLLNEQVYLLVPSDNDSSPLVQKLESCGLLNPGTLLIQSPYDPLEYVPLDQAFSTFVLSKYLHFTTLCQLLGAREVVAEQVEIKDANNKTICKSSLSITDGKIKVEGESNLESNVLEQIKNNLIVRSTFSGGKPDLNAAESHLSKYQLLGDVSMRSLIDQRRGSNPITSREVNLSLSEESQNNLKLAFDLKIPVYADLQAKIERSSRKSYKYTLKIKVDF